jgi:ABC-2 type transport system permease protein
MNKVNHPFWVIVNKEISDHVKSWRFIILIGIIALTCMGSLYTALTNISEAIKPNDPDGSFLFLKLFTVSDGTLPSFVLFINFLGPLLGIALGFDAVNSEQNKGTLSRMLSQPIHRDCIINAKFVAALIVIGIMLFVLGFLVMGCGLIAIGIPPTAEEFWRIVFFIITSIFYVAFWLNRRSRSDLVLGYQSAASCSLLVHFKIRKTFVFSFKKFDSLMIQERR